MKETYLQYQCKECHRWTLALYPEKLCKQCHEDKEEKNPKRKKRVLSAETLERRRRSRERKRGKAIGSKAKRLAKMLEGK